MIRDLRLADAGRFRSAVRQAGKRLWCYAFAFVWSYGHSGQRAVGWADTAGSLAIFLRRRQGAGDRVDLLFPPLPLTPEALEEATGLLDGQNGDRSGRILWVDDTDAPRLGNAGFRLQHKERQYIHVPRDVVALDGGRYHRLRKVLRRVERSTAWEVSVFGSGDVAASLELLQDWRSHRRMGGGRLLDIGYTRLSLQSFVHMDSADLRGIVLRSGGRLRAVCLGGDVGDGPMGASGRGASFLVEKSDLSVPGAGYLARWHFHQAFSDLDFVNDASDLGLTGLSQTKRAFRPVEMLEAFTAARL